jgi:O-antigen/teichoic acid export membrane protein
MAESTTESLPTIDHKPHAAFFRQSGWLMIANIGGGLLTFGVHFLSKSVDAREYAAFGTLLMVVACLPVIPLQMVFAQQTALGLAKNRERELATLVRATTRLLLLIWAVVAFLVVIFMDKIVAGWHLPNAIGLLITLLLVLFSLATPVFNGMMQGRQDFFWIGWAVIIGGFGRVAGAAVLVLALCLGASGMMAGTLIGVSAALFIAIWRTRDIWTLPGSPTDWKATFKQVVPLLFGFGACQLMFTSDTMFAKAYFGDDQMAPYVVAGTLSRALLWLVLPLAAVMFPKIVHASAKSQKTNLFNIVVLGTAILAAGGALGLWLVGPLLVKFVSRPDYVAEATRLIPWYAVAMVPLALANVMVNDLLARGRYGVVPVMVILAVGYAFTLPWMLSHYHRLEVALQTLGVFNLLLFAACAIFIWGVKEKLPAKAARQTIPAG